jgi:hypothetical protein
MTSAMRLLELLGGTAAGGRTDLAAAAREVLAAVGSRRRGLAVLISDLFDPGGWLPALDRLRAAHCEAVVVQITDAADGVAPHMDDGDVVVEDVETGETRELSVTAATRAAHAERYAATLRGITGACRERGVPCFQIAAAVPFDDAVLRILRAGGVVA